MGVVQLLHGSFVFYSFFFERIVTMDLEVIDMIANIGIAFSYVACAYIFYRFGLASHNDEIDTKLDKLYDCAEDLKNRNNQFLTNVSEVYNHLYGMDGQVSDLDVFLMDKWID